MSGSVVKASFNDDKTRRFWLTCDWDPAKPRVVFVMLNPSIAGSGATSDNLDPTLRRCRGFAQRCPDNGGIYVVNLFSKISTDPRGLAGEPDIPSPVERHVLLRVLRMPHPVVCGWGAQPCARPRAQWFLGVAAGQRKKLLCLGRTAAGAPRHPLYLRSDAYAERFTGEAHHG